GDSGHDLLARFCRRGDGVDCHCDLRERCFGFGEGAGAEGAVGGEMLAQRLGFRRLELVGGVEENQILSLAARHDVLRTPSHWLRSASLNRMSPWRIWVLMVPSGLLSFCAISL